MVLERLSAYLVFLKDQDVNWNLSTLSLLGKFLKDYRIQESIWLLNRHQKYDVADLLEYQLKQVLMCAPEAKKEPLGGGATQTWLISFDHGVESEQQIRAVYKPHQANLSSHVGSEVATYLVDRFLKTDLVPLTISRNLDGPKAGSLQYFIKGAVKMSDPSLPEEHKHKTSRMYLLDFLTKNIDRGDYFSEKKIKFEYNYLYLPSLNQLIAIDNSWALRGNYFPAKVKGYWVDKRHKYEKKYSFPKDQVPDPIIYTRVKNLDEEILHETLDGIISDTAINKILKRQPKVLGAFEKAENFEMPVG